jgi:translation initiation factor 2 beta subunit (eIF-2beta)/eIF-5
MDEPTESVEDYIHRRIREWLAKHSDCGGQPYEHEGILYCTCGAIKE